MGFGRPASCFRLFAARRDERERAGDRQSVRRTSSKVIPTEATAITLALAPPVVGVEPGRASGPTDGHRCTGSYWAYCVRPVIRRSSPEIGRYVWQLHCHEVGVPPNA